VLDSGYEPKHQSASPKVTVATHRKETTDVSIPWIGERLAMGSAAYVSKHVGESRREPPPAVDPVGHHLVKVKGKV
jgi:hypothetical protein